MADDKVKTLSVKLRIEVIESARIVAAYKGYGGYQEKTERDIPVVICEPRPG